MVVKREIKTIKAKSISRHPFSLTPFPPPSILSQGWPFGTVLASRRHSVHNEWDGSSPFRPQLVGLSPKLSGRRPTDLVLLRENVMEMDGVSRSWKSCDSFSPFLLFFFACPELHLTSVQIWSRPISFSFTTKTILSLECFSSLFYCTTNEASRFCVKKMNETCIGDKMRSWYLFISAKLLDAQHLREDNSVLKTTFGLYVFQDSAQFLVLKTTFQTRQKRNENIRHRLQGTKIQQKWRWWMKHLPGNERFAFFGAFRA